MRSILLPALVVLGCGPSASPPAGGDTAPGAGDTQAAGGDTTAAAGDTHSGGDTVPGGDTTLAGGDTTATGGDTHSGGDTHAGGDTTLAGGDTHPGGDSNPGPLVADFALEDVNPTSPTAGTIVGPSTFRGKISAWYFGHATWSYCRSQFGYLQQLQDAVDADAIVILGINAVGHESGNPLMCEGRDLAWLQDTATADVWGTWPHEYRDVIIVDRDGYQIGVYNLTAHNLADAESFAELQAMLEAAALP